MEDITPLVQAYASLMSPLTLHWPEVIGCEKLQQLLIEHLILSRHFKMYPPSDAYQRSFWKWIIQHLEKKDEEVDEAIYERYLSLLSASASRPGYVAQPPQPSYITYIRPDSCSDLNAKDFLEQLSKCTLLEARTTIESGTTGLRTWAASFVLADYLVQHQEMLERSRILELGSGVGFLGITIAQIQLNAHEKSESSDSPFSVCLTDANEQVLARCKHNVYLECNKLESHPSLTIKSLDWMDALDEGRNLLLTTSLQEVNPSLILGADLIYDVDIIPALVATLKLTLQLPGRTPFERKALIAATLRNKKTLEIFVEQVRKENLEVHEEMVVHKAVTALNIGNQPDAAGRDVVTVKIFRITWK